MFVLEFIRNTWDVAARLTGAAAGAIGGGSMRMLLILMGMDYAVGLLMGALGKDRSKENGRISWKTVILSFTKKLMILGVVLLCRMLDQIAGRDNGLQSAAIGFYVCNEGISLLQNAAILGVPVPGFMKKALNLLQKNS